jgi:hypothetical protein
MVMASEVSSLGPTVGFPQPVKEHRQPARAATAFLILWVIRRGRSYTRSRSGLHHVKLTPATLVRPAEIAVQFFQESIIFFVITPTIS